MLKKIYEISGIFGQKMSKKNLIESKKIIYTLQHVRIHTRIVMNIVKYIHRKEG